MTLWASIVSAPPTRLESAFMILVGIAISLYGLKARTFREDSHLHILTPPDQLETYEPRWHNRLLVIAGGVLLLAVGIAGLWKK